MQGCGELECKHYIQLLECNSYDGTWDDVSFCTKHKKYIPEEIPCDQIEISHICQNCKHKKEIVYESGTIDSIDYYCKLQVVRDTGIKEKFIYSDIRPMEYHFADFPECPIDKWEER